MTWERAMGRAIAVYIALAVLTGGGAIVAAGIGPESLAALAIRVWLLCVAVPLVLVLLGGAVAVAVALWRGLW